MKRRAVLSLVEDGWWSARALSLALVQDLPVDVHHYVRGRLEPAVRRMIVPYAGVPLTAIERTWFKLARWWLVRVGLAARRWGLIIVDNDRTLAWARRAAARWSVPVVIAREQYRTLSYQWDEQALDAEQVVARLREHDSCA